VWITSAVSIAITFIASKLLLGDFAVPMKVTAAMERLGLRMWRSLTCGGALDHHQLRHGRGRVIPEFTKVSSAPTRATFVKSPIVPNTAERRSTSVALWRQFLRVLDGSLHHGPHASSYYFSQNPRCFPSCEKFLFARRSSRSASSRSASSHGPVTIAVDSYGPSRTTRNRFMIESDRSRKGIKEKSKRLRFDADFENAKYQLEKATRATLSRPPPSPCSSGRRRRRDDDGVGIIILLENLFGDVIPKLSIVQPQVILASSWARGDLLVYRRVLSAVVTGAYRAVFTSRKYELSAKTASEKDSKEVVRICTVYAQKGMWNIFIVVFCFALALPFFNPYFFIGYLIGIAFFGLFQAIFMANAAARGTTPRKSGG